MAPGVPDPLNLVGRLGSLAHARAALLPLPIVDRRGATRADVFPPFERRPARALKDARIGFVGSAGSGACVSLVGVARAFEEAGVRPDAISACSGSVLWGAMWAAGLEAQEMAELSLAWRPEDHLRVQWTGLPRLALSAVRGFTGLATEEALEQLFDRRVWHMSAGEAEIPLHTTVLNLDRGRLERFGSETTPDLTLGELARIALAPPQVGESVRVEGELYVDGGAVDLFPAEPLIDDGGFDRVFGLNVALPPGLDGDARRLRVANHLELARRSSRRLAQRLTLIEPVGGEERTGVGFYDLFLDRRAWPELMRRGYDEATAALAPFRRRRR
jgi:predicted acylesterase/phospholipase RssA